MTPANFVIVWDLDHTLGVFDALEHIADKSTPVTVFVRSGLDSALERLSAQGFVHVVLTLASPAYAEMALRATGLRSHFAEVACAGQRPKGDVEGIATSFGIPIENAADRMIFVGDHPLYDAPRDPRVVFHLEPHALRRSARPLAELMVTLAEAGSGSLRAGFDRLVARSEAALDAETTADEAKLLRLVLPGLGTALLVLRPGECPIIALDDERDGSEGGTAVTFTPADIDLGPA